MMHHIVETRWMAAHTPDPEPKPELHIEPRPEVVEEIENNQAWREETDRRLSYLEEQMQRILDARAGVMIQEKEGKVADH